MNESKVILEEPISFAGETVTEIKFRKPVARDLRKFSLTPSVGDFLDLAKTLGDALPHVIDQLSFADTWAVVGALANFTASGRATGETSLA
jgi:hypothetical protein